MRLQATVKVGIEFENISSIIDALARSKNIDPKMLIENAHVLSKGHMYEEVIKSKLEKAQNADDTLALKRVDALLKGFLSSERKQRSRLKINYILAGANTHRLDEAIQLLSER